MAYFEPKIKKKSGEGYRTLPDPSLVGWGHHLPPSTSNLAFSALAPSMQALHKILNTPLIAPMFLGEKMPVQPGLYSICLS